MNVESQTYMKFLNCPKFRNLVKFPSITSKGTEIVLKAYATLRFLFQYALPVTIFIYCYSRIFHAIRQQSKVVTGHVGRGHDVPMATASSRDHNPGQAQHRHQQQQQHQLSRTEMNVLKTMIAVIICFIVCWSVFSIANLLMLLRASI